MASAIQMDNDHYHNQTIASQKSSGDLKTTSKKVATEFHKELNSILKTKPPISKERMSLIVAEAIKAARNYKHVVYYVESFIKNVRAFD